MDLFFRNDALSDAIFSLRMVDEHLNRVAEDSSFWKWVIIALHNSLQGFMAVGVCTTDGLTAIQDRSKDKKHIRARLEGRKKGIPRLWDFCQLYQRIQWRAIMCRFVDSKQFEPTQEVTESACRLNDTRNKLTHYFPNLFMSLSVDNWPPMINHCMDVIEFLCFESRNILWRRDTQQKEVKSLIHDIRQLTDRIEKELSKIWEESEQ